MFCIIICYPILKLSKLVGSKASLPCAAESLGTFLGLPRPPDRSSVDPFTVDPLYVDGHLIG